MRVKRKSPAARRSSKGRNPTEPRIPGPTAPSLRLEWNKMEQNGTELKVCHSYALLAVVPDAEVPRLGVATALPSFPAKAANLASPGPGCATRPIKATRGHAGPVRTSERSAERGHGGPVFSLAGRSNRGQTGPSGARVHPPHRSLLLREKAKDEGSGDGKSNEMRLNETK